MADRTPHGTPIPDSRYFRAYCAKCGEPIRVELADLTQPNWCGDCEDFAGDDDQLSLFETRTRNAGTRFCDLPPGSFESVLSRRERCSLALWSNPDDPLLHREIAKLHGIGRTGVTMRIIRARRKLKAMGLPVPQRPGCTAPKYMRQASAVGDLFS